MSSILERYKVIQREGDKETPEEEINEYAESACAELHDSLQERSKYHEAKPNTLVIQTGNPDTPGIEVEVKGYAAQEGVTTAKAQEDSTSPALPPTDKINDQVSQVRQYNTAKYMEHSMHNPKKFG